MKLLKLIFGIFLVILVVTHAIEAKKENGGKQVTNRVFDKLSKSHGSYTHGQRGQKKADIVGSRKPNQESAEKRGSRATGRKQLVSKQPGNRKQ
jgi:hypothetical protein